MHIAPACRGIFLAKVFGGILRTQLSSTCMSFKITPEITASILKRMQEKEKARKDFSQSAVFVRMVRALTDSAEPKMADCETIAYFFDREIERLGWQGVTKDEVNHFFDVIGDSRAETVVPGSMAHDEECSFYNEEFQHYGLWVHVMVGQGTAVSVENAAFRAKREQEKNAKAG